MYNSLRILFCDLGCGHTFALLNPKEFNFCSMIHRKEFAEKNPGKIEDINFQILYRWDSQSPRIDGEDARLSLGELS